MPAVPVKEMLNTLLTQRTLTAKEREAFNDMWDAAHRYGNLSRRQTAWIEEVYYKQDAKAPTNKQRATKTGFVNVQGVAKPLKARSLKHFKELLPNASDEMIGKVTKFFQSGGEVIEIRPPKAP